MKAELKRGVVALVAAALVSLGSLGLKGSDLQACALHDSAPPVSTPVDSDRAADGDRGSGEQIGAGDAPAKEARAAADGQGAGLEIGGQVQVLGNEGALRFGGDDTGQAYLRDGTLMLRGELWVNRSWGLAVSVPLARRRLELPTGATERLQGLGDIGLELAWQMGAGAKGAGVGAAGEGGQGLVNQPWVLQLRVGALLPTAPLMRHGDGQWYHPDVQLGAGVVVPRVAVGVRYQSRSDFGFFVGADAMGAPESPDGVQRGATARLEPGAVWYGLEHLSLQVTTPLRYQAQTTTDGAQEVATGGWLWSVVPQIRWQPLARLSIQAGPTLPVVQALRGNQRESIGLRAATSWRF